MAELMPCGTRAAYIRHVRRGEVPDEPCVKASRDYMKQEQAERAATPFHLIPHGLGGYRNYGCRCETCTEAQKRSCVAYRLRRRRPRGPAPGTVLLAAGLDPAAPWPPEGRTEQRNPDGSTTDAGRAERPGTTRRPAAARLGGEVEGESRRAR